ncbi:hypothetical protein ATE84_4231 [Aquimarina sp. MAR_2010_214]|uniref:hypothetical protein n=1 Tax=Aquimarina sp. MAR_2010_214 TaxID=1250026 RepID=UPI000C7131F5|nr:hypothetical protein [Aquimarina sp. MAR_2010_214]PKV52129.1 hypothetical protein ATE84_4231 [Aquimarina sp. MAR_2010_214]
MKKINITYLLTYFAFLIVICVAIFFDKWLLIYVKPIVPVSLILLYQRFAKKTNFLFPLSMLVIAVTDVFVYLDFMKYFSVIAILIASFYTLCLLLLKDFISIQEIKLNKLISPPAIVGVLLIGYLIFAITGLVLPKIINSIESIILIILSLLLFVTVCFFIYVANRYEKSIYLFIASCCTLFVDAFLAINELYYYSRSFTTLINIVEIAGIYFFTIFLVETKLVKKERLKDKYL